MRAGGEEGREGVMAAGLAPLLPALLRNEREEEAQEAAVWCIINLTRSGAEFPGAAERVAALRQHGVRAFPTKFSKLSGTPLSVEAFHLSRFPRKALGCPEQALARPRPLALCSAARRRASMVRSNP